LPSFKVGHAEVVKILTLDGIREVIGKGITPGNLKTLNPEAMDLAAVDRRDVMLEDRSSHVRGRPA